MYLALLFAPFLFIMALFSFLRKKKDEGGSESSKLTGLTNTKFFGSQIGGKAVINYSYTDMPWKLMAWDVFYFFKFLWAIPFVVWPLTPADSGELGELSFTFRNMFCLAVHFVLIILQVIFILGLPALIFLPVWTSIGIFALVLGINKALCMLLNGSTVEYHSNPEYAPALPEHAHEQWIFINGVAAGEHWMQSNLDRLALTFKRPILGIHNKTSGILFDVLECLIQRNWGYATTDVRVCYRIIKEKLYNPTYTKVVFLLHSQGAIEGSLIIDWLLQELPQDLLSKLEVYTFGNASNHFNNPHRHVDSQNAARHHHHSSPIAPRIRNPIKESSSSSLVSSPLRNSTASTLSSSFQPATDEEPPIVPLTKRQTSSLQSLTSSTLSPSPSSLTDRAIGHIEHYAHTTDFVALWGVLHFSTSSLSSTTLPRFIGRVFARTTPRGGHQMVQHYLDGMFPLARSSSGELLRDPQTGVIVGGCLDGEGENEFMESEVVLGGSDNPDGGEREGDEEEDDEDEPVLVELHGASPVLERRLRRKQTQVKVKVKELSRLWQYRNGRSPEDHHHRGGGGVAGGVIRGSSTL
ncbi:hypothetical protein QBC35DRAFT_424547 [Podospora australis]|uniref:Uncharacterized protein n=1 Tax=Podospora australis TaxID=1536484 RepID=A0AAN6X1G9_9PEZI|nr:hypothetical protein QBC35DRAFT_424547 [Podospora australis]